MKTVLVKCLSIKANVLLIYFSLNEAFVTHYFCRIQDEILYQREQAPPAISPTINWYICQSFKYSIPTCMPQPLRTERASVSWLSERIIVSKDLDKESLRPPGSWHSSVIQGMGLSQSSLTHMELKPRSSLFQVNTLTPATACSLAGPSL